jgi:hypothetical protein
MKAALPGRRLAAAVALFAAALLLLAAAPAAAEPGEENGVPNTLLGQLDVAAAAYNDAKAVYDASKARQTGLDAKLQETELRLTILQSQVGSVANAAYRGSRLNLTAALLDSGTPETLLRSAMTVHYLTVRDDAKLREYNNFKKEYADRRKAIDTELALQEQQFREMERRKNDAAKALAAAGGGGLVNGVPVPVATAAQAPRNANGSWPPQSCSVKDPTTSSCLTPRMLHAYNEARKAGFTRFTGCYRGGSFGEHPKGRACDFSAHSDGFRNYSAAGGDRTYGDRLAGWCVGNAGRIGVLYVIWYRNIWFPGLGWRVYRSGGSDPASAHTNHVHLSVQ